MEFLVPLGYCLGGFLIFYLAFDLFSRLEDFQKAELKTMDVIMYELVTMPEIMGRVVPVGLLLAMLYALTNHARYNELTAMRCAGLSLANLCVPYFGVAICFGSLIFVVNEILMPDSGDVAQNIMNKYRHKGADEDRAKWARNLAFINAAGGRTWQIGAYHLQTSEMLKPHVSWQKPEGIRLDLYAERATYGNGIWHFFQVQQFTYQTNQALPDRLSTNYLAVAEFDETPHQIRSEIKISSMSNLKQIRGLSLSLMEVIEYQRWHPDARHDHRLNTKFHARVAAPFTCLIVVLIAIPFGAASGRRNVFVGVASSIFFCFGYFVVQKFGEALGLGGRIPPWVAGWSPNLFFAGLGMLMMIRVR